MPLQYLLVYSGSGDMPKKYAKIRTVKAYIYQTIKKLEYPNLQTTPLL